MKFSSDLPTTSTPRRKKHRRALPASSSTSRDPQEDTSPPYSVPSDSASDEEGKNDAASRSQLESYSFSGSSCTQPSSAYVNVAPLPVFCGEASECPVAHLARFDRVCRANNATDVGTLVRIFPVTLDGDAALWYDLAVEPYRPPLQWPEIRAAFLRAFTRPDFANRARAELMGLEQRDGEGVNTYHLRLQWILRKWPDHGFPDALLKGIFVDGLKEDYQDWILPQHPATLVDAVKLALSWEQVRSVREARKGNDGASGGAGLVKCGFCDGGHEERDCQVRSKMRDLWLRNKEAAAAAMSPAMSMVKREGGSDEALARTGSMKRAGQCQCWKHQCWKKLERSNSSNIATATDTNANVE